MRKLGETIVFLATAYAVMVAALFFLQRSMIYPGGRAAEVPPGFVEVSLVTEDALELRAAWRAPEPGFPVAVMFHGNADNWYGGYAVTRGLAQRGYGVLLPAYRGYSGNPGRPSEEGLYRDGRAALAWLSERGHGREETILVGQSIGAGVAVEMARDTEPAALVLLSPFTSLPDAAAERMPLVPARHLVLDRYDNLGKIGRIEAPILIVHGDRDSLIPLAHSQRLARAAGTEVEVIEGYGHDAGYSDVATARVADWLARLPPES
jgi:uncharacterized protein